MKAVGRLLKWTSKVNKGVSIVIQATSIHQAKYKAEKASPLASTQLLYKDFFKTEIYIHTNKRPTPKINRMRQESVK